MSSTNVAWTIPVVDLSLLPSDFYLKGTQQDVPKSLLTTVREACEQVGFFRIINHGIPETLIGNLDSAARRFFREPKEVKERAVSSMLYRGYVAGGKDPVSPTPESLIFADAVRSDSIPEICDKLWPQGNTEFREPVESYAGKMIELSNLLLKLCLCCFEADLSRYMSTFENKCQGWLNMNNYSPDGVQRIYRAHTDKSWITILHQDEVGGLEVLTPQGEWSPVEYERGSLVVNVGDIFQMWSNRRYRSSEHRVIYGGQKNRQSFAFFYLFDLDMEIRAAEELVDEEHPEYYKPTVFQEFEKHGRDNGLSSLGPPEAFVKQT